MIKTNSQQSGRSMVEMLGVLAIIGVLSIAGIGGYKIAMDMNKSNLILNKWKETKQKTIELLAQDPQSNVILNEDIGDDVSRELYILLENDRRFLDIMIRTPFEITEDICLKFMPHFINDLTPSSEFYSYTKDKVNAFGMINGKVPELYSLEEMCNDYKTFKKDIEIHSNF